MTCQRFLKRRGRTSVILVLIIGACFVVKISIEPLLDVHSEIRSSTTYSSKAYSHRMTTKMEVHRLAGIVHSLDTNNIRNKETNQRMNGVEKMSHVRSQNANAERSIAKLINSGKDISYLDIARGKQTKVLILAYYRSGSTLTGSFFNHHPNVFYSFEPLHALHKSMILGRSLYYFDQTKRPAPKEKDLPELTLDILQAIFSCNFNRLDYKSLIGGFLRQSFSFIEFAACLRAAPYGIHNMPKIEKRCIAPLMQKCLSSDAIVIKTIRTSMPIAEKLLNLFPDLKIIHLQRDPRGMACSLHKGTCLGGYRALDERCSTMSTDIGQKNKMTKELRTRVLNVQYESITETPLKIVEDMFNFANISMHNNVMAWTYNTLLSEMHINGSMSLHKKNPLATAYKWTERIHWRVVQKVEDVCMDVLLENKYPRFTNIEEVRNFKLPITNHTEQKLQMQSLLTFSTPASPR